MTTKLSIQTSNFISGILEEHLSNFISGILEEHLTNLHFLGRFQNHKSCGTLKGPEIIFCHKINQFHHLTLYHHVVGSPLIAHVHPWIGQKGMTNQAFWQMVCLWHECKASTMHASPKHTHHKCQKIVLGRAHA